jgi:hypothetical protein
MIRIVSQLGSRTCEKTLLEKLETLYPAALYQFNISVWGEFDTTEVSVRLWRRDPFIQVDGTIHEYFEGDLCDAILQTVADFVEDFSRERGAA